MHCYRCSVLESIRKNIDRYDDGCQNGYHVLASSDCIRYETNYEFWTLFFWFYLDHCSWYDVFDEEADIFRGVDLNQTISYINDPMDHASMSVNEFRVFFREEKHSRYYAGLILCLVMQSRVITASGTFIDDEKVDFVNMTMRIALHKLGIVTPILDHVTWKLSSVEQHVLIQNTLMVGLYNTIYWPEKPIHHNLSRFIYCKWEYSQNLPSDYRDMIHWLRVMPERYSNMIKGVEKHVVKALLPCDQFDEGDLVTQYKYIVNVVAKLYVICMLSEHDLTSLLRKYIPCQTKKILLYLVTHVAYTMPGVSKFYIEYSI